MQKTKSKKFIVAIVMFSMVAMYAVMPAVNAASFTNAQDTITDSTLDATAVSHEVVFTSTQAIPINGYFEVVFAAEFGNVLVGNITCPSAGANTAPNTETAKCAYVGGLTAGQATTTITGIDNPVTGDGAGAYNVTVTSYTQGGVEIENSQMKVYILDGVTVTAHVDATLSFTVAGLNNGDTVNGETLTATSTATTTPFGTLSTVAPSVVGQRLSVTTNASDGFSVTVQADGELTSAGGANINSFKDAADNAGLTTPEAWAAPTGTLGNNNEYGHMGLTTSDTTLKGAEDFSLSKFAGLVATNAMEVFSHTSAANSTIDGTGYADVAYKVGITALQEAGDYSAQLTYICTPTF